MRFKKKNGIYRMDCMGLEDPYYHQPFPAIASKKNILKGGSGGMIGGGTSSAGLTCQPSSIAATGTLVDYWAVAVSQALTVYQTVTTVGAVTVCRLDIHVWKDTAGDAHIEIWDSGGSAQVGGDSDVNSETGDKVMTFTWSSNSPSLDAATGYRIVIVNHNTETTFNVRTVAGTAYSGGLFHQTGGNTDQDAYFTLYTMQ